MKRIRMGIVAIFLVACGTTGSEKKVDKNQATFRTTADSRLYFRNVRQIYYDKEIQPNTRLELYRFGKRNKSQDRPVINVLIANNWLHDEAYLLIEPNSYFENPQTIEITWQDTKNQQSGTYTFAPGSKEDHFRFVTALYQSILAGHQLMVKDKNGNPAPLFTSEGDRDNFRKTVKDYFRLVNRL